MAHLRGQDRTRYVTRMFARVSPRYDLLNAVMTAGRHSAWRRMAVDLATGGLRGQALDVATGTGDFALDLARKPYVSHVVGLDNTREMLSVAARKTARKSLAERLTLVVGDAHALPVPDDHFVCATVGFGVRNFVDVPQALREMARVVRPGGRVVSLEMVHGEGTGPFTRLLALCFRRVTPWLGAVLAGDREAYTYLPESVQGFLSASELASMMEGAGLQNVTFHRLALGTVTIHVGEKGPGDLPSD